MGDANTNGWRHFDELYDQTPHTPTGKAKVIAYIPTWRKEEGFDYGNAEMYQYITHGIIAFLTFSDANPGEFDAVSVTDVSSILPDVVMAGNLANTKMMIALGGANDFAFLDLMTAVGNDPASPLLGKAVDRVAAFVASNGLDGVDLDLECWWGRPGQQDQGGRAKADGPHPAGRGLRLFAQRLKQAMPDKIVSSAVFGTSWYGNNYDPAIADHVDWLGVMTYDLTGSWDLSPVGPHTALLKIRGQDTADIRESDVYQETYLPEQQGGWPAPRGGTASAASRQSSPASRHVLYPLTADTENIENNPILSVEDTLWYWTNPLFVNWQGAGQGVDRGKIAAGVPVYGYDFVAGKDPDDLTGEIPSGYRALRYKEILDAFPDAHDAVDANIKVAGSTPRPALNPPLPPGDYPYAHNIYFETPGTAVAKLNFLKNVGAQGVIIWELTNDVWEEGKSIIKALYRASGNPEPVPITDPPALAATHCLWDSVGFLGGTTGNLQFQDDGIVRSGVRQFSARLWNIPDGDDWVGAAMNSPAVIRRQYFNRPSRIVDKGALGLWGEFDVVEDADVPAWDWGHMETESGAPEGFTRYRARLWGLSLSDDWQAAARQTPALISGHFFAQPTEIDDQGVGGLYGLFDVDDKVGTIPWVVAQAHGDNDCAYCSLQQLPHMDNVAHVNLTTTMSVGEGTPYLYSATTRDDGSADFPDGVVMTVEAPDGTLYNQSLEDDNHLVVMSGSSVRGLIVKDPQAGDWIMRMSVPTGVGYHCKCNTIPSTDVFDTMVATSKLLHGLQGLEPRSGLGDTIAAFLTLGALAVMAPEVLTAAVFGGVVLAATAVGLAGIAIASGKASASGTAQNMAEASGIISKVAKDFLSEGWPVLGKYTYLLGKNISKEECDVIRRYPQNLFNWLGIHRRVYQVVEHMTDAEEQNAVRHVFWQCLLKKRLGEEFAKAMGEAHEIGRPGSDADNLADEKNNVIGLRLADEVASEDDCLQRAREMWTAGQLATRIDLEGDPT
ncbi:glycoside hydrolase family 18 protein [Streptomyces sp. NWU339]|uniref:glycoside hydrolase family 18 protein n=1 Tax=Streptomyces sp. NWU339 TaxID=2185284 RepID=UPI0015E7E5F8|nr:glycoside hydrolase family 18 protein [Streptomyces sp. NWU339]